MTETNTQNQITDQCHQHSIYNLVMYFLLFVGLSAEFFAIKSIIVKKNIITSDEVMWIIQASIITMLIHQFFIIRNFHILDSIQPNEYNKYSIGDWIAKSRVEDFLRFLLFVLFSCLTGEVVYLFLVGTEFIDFFKSFISIKEEYYYDMSWLSKFFVGSALIMSLLMLIWDFVGICYDRPIKLPHYRKYEKEDKIVYYPFNSPYYTFFISDIFGVGFWMLIWGIVFKGLERATIWITLFIFAYATIIITRLIVEFLVNFKKIKEKLRDYCKYTKW